MDIKERFYANLEMLREDYGKRDADDAKELENIASGKVSRKSDKKIQKMFKRDAAKLRKKAVTGMDEQTEQLDELRGYRKKKLFGKDPLVAVANRAINRMKLPPHKGKLSPEEIKSNRKNRKVSQMAFDRMPD